MKENKLHKDTHSGFKTPDNYFESFDEKVLNQLHSDQILNNIDGHAFKVPDGYFKEIDSNILSNIKSEPSVITLKPRPKLYYLTGIAASLLLLFAIFINNNDSDEEISAEMVETYFQNSDLDSYELAQLLSEAEMLEEDFIITETTYSEENLESYLLENADLEQFIE
ncbi:hypothetical protein AB9K26_08420 [Psychroserpens sp. XS_ASV72]|uniref:hypothetical protein n=1 Tax=Psychroserpens sp. XS_ASV72 TaxID=3241293 RepID=UPI003511D4B8